MPTEHSPRVVCKIFSDKMLAKVNPFPALDVRQKEELAQQIKSSSVCPAIPKLCSPTFEEPTTESAIKLKMTPKPIKIDEFASRDNIRITPVLKTPKETSSTLIEAAMKRGRSPEEEELSIAKQRLSSPPPSQISKSPRDFCILCQTIQLDVNNKVIKENISLNSNKTNEVQAKADEAVIMTEEVETNQKLKMKN